ncbi:MAG: N-acetylneuraminate lyase [Eubacteriales bacterium]
MKKIGGVIPAIFTPFAKDGSVNTEQLARLAEFNLAKGVSGFYVNGSSGEAFLLTDEERRLVYKTVKETVGDRAACIAQVGCISTAQAIGFAKYAAELKYDAISAVAPFYYKFSNKEIMKYYFDLVDASGMPLLIYNIPALSGVELSFEDISTLLRDERIIGVKHTSSDFYKLQRIRNAFPDKVLLNGYDEMFASGMMAGADGGIGSTYNFMAEKFIRIMESFRANDLAEVQRVQNEANLVITEVLKYGVMPGCKAILDTMGLDMGDSRPPFSPLTKEQKTALCDAVKPLL